MITPFFPKAQDKTKEDVITSAFELCLPSNNNMF